MRRDDPRRFTVAYQDEVMRRWHRRRDMPFRHLREALEAELIQPFIVPIVERLNRLLTR